VIAGDNVDLDQCAAPSADVHHDAWATPGKILDSFGIESKITDQGVLTPTRDV
jgi:hypothetical protein